LRRLHDTDGLALISIKADPPRPSADAATRMPLQTFRERYTSL
jgi:hypothetical protein